MIKKMKKIFPFCREEKRRKEKKPTYLRFS